MSMQPDRPARRSPNIVYFIKCGPYIKIGVTCDIAIRLTDMQVGCPYDMEVIGTIDGGRCREKEIHGILAKSKHRGEWFHYSRDVEVLICGFLGKQLSPNGPCGSCGGVVVRRIKDNPQFDIWHCRSCDAAFIATDARQPSQ